MDQHLPRFSGRTSLRVALVGATTIAVAVLGAAVAPLASAMPAAGGPCQAERAALDASNAQITRHDATPPDTSDRGQVEQYDAAADALNQHESQVYGQLQECLRRYGVVVQPPIVPAPSSSPSEPQQQTAPAPTAPAPEPAPEAEPYDLQENLDKALDWLNDRLEELDEMQKKDSPTDHDCSPDQQKHDTT